MIFGFLAMLHRLDDKYLGQAFLFELKIFSVFIFLSMLCFVAPTTNILDKFTN